MAGSNGSDHVMNGDPNDLMTIEHAARVFGIDIEIMQAFVAKEIVPSVRGRDGAYYLRGRDVEAYLAPGRRLAEDWRRRGLV